MDGSTVWWVLAGLVVVAELLTGSLYLLMVALGLAAGAVGAHMGVGLSLQIAAAGIVGSVATAAWHLHHSRNQPTAPKTSANKDINLDVGETVVVEAWASDGIAQVRFRGANWQASMADDASPTGVGTFRIAEVIGNRLMLTAI